MTITIRAMGELLAEFLSRNLHQELTQPEELIKPSPSSVPAVSVAQVAKLPHWAVFFGCVGNSDFGQLIIEYLRHEGVTTDRTHVMNNVATGMAFVSYQNPQQRDFVSNIPNSVCGLSIVERTGKDLFRQYNHLHTVDPLLFLSCMIDVMRKAITTIKSAGGTVSSDPNTHKKMLSVPEMAQTLDYLTKYTDIFIPSENEFPFFVRRKNLSEEQIAGDLLYGGVKHVMIKRAQHGASYYRLRNSTPHAQHVAGHDIEIIDPTGAGDYFGATFIALLLSGSPIHKALQCANVSGVPIVMQQGPMEGIFSPADIGDLLQQH